MATDKNVQIIKLKRNLVSEKWKQISWKQNYFYKNILKFQNDLTIHAVFRLQTDIMKYL